MTYCPLLYFQKKKKRVRQHVVYKLRFWLENRHNLSFAQKTKNSSLSTQKLFINTLITPTNHYINSKYLKKAIQNLINFVLAFQLRSYFSNNIEDHNNQHEIPLISWNLQTPRKLILIAKNRVNNEFFFPCWNSITLSLFPLPNQVLKNKTNELGYEN